MLIKRRLFSTGFSCWAQWATGKSTESPLVFNSPNLLNPRAVAHWTPQGPKTAPAVLGRTQEFQNLMFNQLLTYLTIQALFGWLESDDIRCVSSHAINGEISESQEFTLIDLFEPLIKE